MWIVQQGMRQPEPQSVALEGRVTLGGDPAAVYLDGEQRELPVFGPGGYVWRPAQDEQVLVLKMGSAGEEQCVLAQRCGDEIEIKQGEILIYSGGSAIHLRRDGIIDMSGIVRVNGKQVLTMG